MLVWFLFNPETRFAVVFIAQPLSLVVALYVAAVLEAEEVEYNVFYFLRWGMTSDRILRLMREKEQAGLAESMLEEIKA
jgi:hypothetical protein